MDPIGSFSGLASGVQWRDMVDQIMQLEAARRLDPLKNQVSSEQKRADAWNSLGTLVTKLRDAARGLRDGSAFGAFTVTAGNSPTTSRALLSASASGSAVPGSYKVEVLDLARAEKLSGAVVADANAALGIAGEFVINGKRLEIASTDSLNSIRDKINAANSGTAPTRVSATILSTGGTSSRLVLTSDISGAAGIELTDGTTGALRQLGFVDGTQVANATANGGTQSNRVSSVTASIAALLGVSLPPPSTITVGGKTITVDLSVDSISSIVARINAAGGSATTETDTTGGVTSYRMVVSGTASASTADGQRALELLGLTQGGRGAVVQSLLTQNQLTDAVGATATTSTLLTDLGTNGTAASVQAGDTFTIRGTRADGTAVNVTYTVAAGDTLQSLLTRLNSAVDGFGAGSRPATATLSGGKIRLVDGTGGDSQLSLSIVANNEGGGTLSFGQTATETAGRLREVVSGTDAKLRVDGVLLSRSSNTITDVLSGVTLSLQQAEAGTTVDLTVARDLDGVVSSAQKFASAYNEVVAFVGQQSAAGKPLAFNGTLRATMASFTNALLTNVAGLGSTSYTRASVAGVSLTSTGTLEVDATKLKAALASNLNDVKALFGTNGSTTDGELQYVSSTDQSQAGRYAVEITAAATTPARAGSGFGGTYADDASTDTMTLTDATTGRSGSIQLANGDTIDTIVSKLNTLFQSQAMQLTASKSGTNLVITGSQYGSAATFTVAYAAGGADGSAQLGLAAGTYAGTDVQGTIGGLGATGSGQVLTGTAGGATEGLAVKYTGATARSAGEVAFVLGVGGMMARVADAVIRSGDGTVAGQVDSVNRSIDSLNRRADDVQGRLDRRRESLVRQFAQMEQALSRIQAQGNWLTSQLAALSSGGR